MNVCTQPQFFAKRPPTHTYIYINKIQVYKYITTQSIAAIRIIIELSNSPAQTTHRHRNLYGTSTVLGFFADSFSWQLAMYSGWLQRWHITKLSWMLLKFPLSPWEKDVFDSVHNSSITKKKCLDDASRSSLDGGASPGSFVFSCIWDAACGTD